MSVKKKFIAFEKAFITQWGEYIKLQDELNLYRGKELGEETEKVNELLLNIQRTFLDMYPAMQFVMERHPLFIKAINGYNKFIDDLKKAGATEEETPRA